MKKRERTTPARRHRQEHEKQELRQTILDVAGELFVEQGYEHFSMRKVADRIGCSATTLYLYFRDKDDLLFTIVDDGFIQFSQRLSQVVDETTDPLEQILMLGREYVAFGLEHAVYYQLMFMQRTDFLLLSQEGESQPRVYAFQILEEAVQRAIDARLLHSDDAEGYSDLLWGMVHGLVSLAITMPFFPGDRLEKAMKALQQLILVDAKPN
jgi:AcrR family transcriptional regulator